MKVSQKRFVHKWCLKITNFIFSKRNNFKKFMKILLFHTLFSITQRCHLWTIRMLSIKKEFLYLSISSFGQNTPLRTSLMKDPNGYYERIWNTSNYIILAKDIFIIYTCIDSNNGMTNKIHKWWTNLWLFYSESYPNDCNFNNILSKSMTIPSHESLTSTYWIYNNSHT